jgi:hypothetical protein
MRMRPLLRSPVLFLALLAPCAAGLAACADPSEVRLLRGSKAMLEAELAVQRQVLADEELYRQALKDVPLAGTALDPAEVTARVTRAAAGVAVSVERDPNGGVNISLSGSASGPRAAVMLAQLAEYLPDLSLSQASLRADGFSARGAAVRRGPAVAPIPREEPARISLAQLRALRAEVEALAREVQAGRPKVDADLARRGPAAVEALKSPDRFRQQAAVLQKLAGGSAPLAATAEVTFDAALITAGGTLAPGRQAMDAMPLFKPDYELQGIRADAGRFELKLVPRATAH